MILIILAALFFAPPLWAQNAYQPVRCAVITAHFDSPAAILESMGVRYTVLPHKQIENTEALASFDTIFFPCGIGISPETSINILSRGTKLQGISLDDRYYKVDDNKTAEAIRNFITNGGTACFSDFSIDLMHRALGNAVWHRDFANLGIAGSVDALAAGPFAAFLGRDRYPVLFGHSGWVVPKAVKRAEALLTGNAPTPLGPLAAQLAGTANVDDGTIYYSAFHDSGTGNELVRFLAAQALTVAYRAKNARYIGGWDLDPGMLISDFSRRGEYSREYRLDLPPGRNTFFGFFSSGKWRVEVRDAHRRELGTLQEADNLLRLDLPKGTERIYVTVLNTGGTFGAAYSIGTGNGLRLFPYWKRILIWSAVLAVFSSLAILRKRKMDRAKIRDDGLL